MIATPSKYWEKLHIDHEDVMKQSGYENFKRGVGVLIYNNIGVHYDENGKSDRLQDNYFEKLEELWEGAYQELSPDILDRLYEPKEGNPFTIDFKGRQVSYDLLMAVYEYWTIKACIDMNMVKTIHEIGAGYGKTAYVISTLHPKIKYRIFDLKPSLDLSSRYLPSVLPGHDFEFYTPDQIQGDCDLMIAVNCLHEMSRKQVEEYFEYCDRHAKFLYYSCWKDTTVPYEDIRWRHGDYPVNGRWKLLTSRDSYRSGFFEEVYKVK